MTIKDLTEALGLENLTPGVVPDDAAIDQGYASDLLSDVLANAPGGGVLVTLQVHLNVLAVASHAGLKAVIFAGDRRPDEEVLARAAEEEIALFVTPADTFSVAGRLYELGIRGTTDIATKEPGA